jgi:putative ABC transport system permease protein
VEALSLTGLALALGMVVIAIALSVWQKLGLEINLAIATGRAVMQLLVLGYLLDIVFALKNPWIVLGTLAVLLTLAAIVTRNRISKKVPFLLPLVWGSLFVSTALTLGYTYLLVLQTPTWYEPQYLIPLAGVILANAMNAAAIAGERLTTTVNSSHLEIETHLSLGATPQQAIAQYRREAIKAGLVPTLNAMMIAGMVTLPDLVTGQLLGGASPLNAISYQILILLMLAFATLTTTLLLTQGLCQQFFNRAAQLALR